MAGLDEAASAGLLRSVGCVVSMDGLMNIQEESGAFNLFGAGYRVHK